MQLPLTLQLGPSARFATLLIGGHILAGVAVSALARAMPLRFLLFTLLLISGSYCLRRHVRQEGARGVRAISLRPDGELDLHLRSGACVGASVLANTTVFASLIVLNYVTADYRGTLVLLPDGMGSEAHRQLRLWLRWRHTTKPR